MYKQIATYENGVWSTTDFETYEEFRSFVTSIFKEPGQYDFDETAFAFNLQARLYNADPKNKIYCMAPNGTKDYRVYWDDQKDKCRNGAIFKNGDRTWYLTRDYYMWINYLRIYDKIKKRFDFPEVWDTHYHMALYELLAELYYKHAAVIKKRQIGSSYFHMSKFVNQVWFEEGVTMKMGASHKDYINDKGSWKFLEEYRSFLNEHTAWYRPFDPDKVLMWQQQTEITLHSRKSMAGNKGVIQGLTFDKDPTNGVGGGIRFFFYEEAGIAPTMGITVEYLFPAMKSGDLTSGTFIAAGSVGELDQCEPLKAMILKPEDNDIYPVKTDLLDEKSTLGTSGLFIPEQWSMPPYIDEYGNSVIYTPTPAQAAFIKPRWEALNPEEVFDPTMGALQSLNMKFEHWKKTLPPEKFQLRASQHPRNIAEAFAHRKTSPFPIHLVSQQLKRIDDKEYPYEFLELSRNAQGGIEAKESSKLPIIEFPITSRMENKEGVLVVWERPVKDADFGTYYGSVDPVGEGRTTTSDSLCSILIYKTAVQVTKITDGEPKTYIERDKIVASWCGRFDDINKTHEMLELIIEWYNAWTIVENNISLFIQHMIERKKQRYLVPKDQILFLKDLSANQNVFQTYGWKNTGTLFSSHLLSYGIEYLKEELDHETKPDGTIVKTIYGVERIPDPMLLKEMVAYQPKLNVDRLVTFCSLVAFAKVQEANRGLKKRVEDDKKNLQKSKDLYKLSKNPFHNIGGSGTDSMKIRRNPFKNLR